MEHGRAVLTSKIREIFSILPIRSQTVFERGQAVY